MLQYVMKAEKEVTENIFCKDAQALFPALCWWVIQATVHTFAGQETPA